MKDAFPIYNGDFSQLFSPLYICINNMYERCFQLLLAFVFIYDGDISLLLSPVNKGDGTAKASVYKKSMMDVFIKSKELEFSKK